MDSNIGLRIKTRRKELGLTQTELANKLGLTSKSTISKIECGEDNLTTTNIKKYAEALETTPAWLLGLNIETDNQHDNGSVIIAYENAVEDAELIKLFHELNPQNKKIAIDNMKTLLSYQVVE